MRQIKIVMQFEFLTFVRSGGFIGSAIFMMLLAFVGPAIPTAINFFSNREGGNERRIAIVDNTGQFHATTIESYTSRTVSMFDNIIDARRAVATGDYDYAASLYADRFTLYVTTMGMNAWNMGDDLAMMLRDHQRIIAFAQAGIDPIIQAEIMAFTPHSEVLTLRTDGTASQDAQDDFFANIIFSYALSFILYFGLLMGSAYFTAAVSREKSTKTMEMLITSCKASHLLNGKVLGVGAAIMLQLFLMLSAAALSIHLFAGAGSDGALGAFNLTFDPFIMGMMVLFFLLAFLMYAYMNAALISMTKRIEDATALQGLPMYFVIAGFLGSVWGINNPGASWVVVFSHIPFFAPFVMFMRVCINTAAPWEIAVSIIAQIVTVCLMAYLGGRIYRMGTLMYGNKLKLKEILAALK